MSETSASKSAFDPNKFCECQKCFSVHLKGSVAVEVRKPAASIVDANTCKHCSGTGFVDHVVDGEKLGVKRCQHREPQGEMPF
jgi:hypothetical protein